MLNQINILSSDSVFELLLTLHLFLVCQLLLHLTRLLVLALLMILLLLRDGAILLSSSSTG